MSWLYLILLPPLVFIIYRLMASSYRSVATRDWERADRLNVELVGYGWEEKRVIVRFHLPKDRDFDRTKLTTMLMVRDVKHSKNWTCEFCGSPARETHVQTLSWQHLEPPRLVLYLHYVCDMTQPHVKKGLREIHNFMNMANMGRLGPYRDPAPGSQPGEVYPLAGSCLSCERDETAASGEGMKKCSKCKLTRYCSVDCQKKDWPRHKVTCGKIHSVTFENWD